MAQEENSGASKQSTVRSQRPRVCRIHWVRHSDSSLLSPVPCLPSPALQKMKVHPEICMKTKGGQNQVTGVRCQKRLDKDTDGLRQVMGNSKFKIQDEAPKRHMTGYPQKCLKRMNWLPQRSAFGRNTVARFADTEINRSRSILRDGILSPDSDLLSPALQKMKAYPEMCMKTKEGGKTGIRYQVPGVRQEVRSPVSEVPSPKAKSPNAFCADIMSPDSCFPPLP